MTQGETLEAIKYTRGNLQILNQLLIPNTFTYEIIDTTEKAFHAIVDMKVRGAPAIAVVAALSLAVEAEQKIKAGQIGNVGEMASIFLKKLEYLKNSRPTAVNLFIMADDFKTKINNLVTMHGTEHDGKLVLETIINEAEELMNADVAENEAISKFGAEHIQSMYPDNSQLRIITHCNTGALATMKYGTALGVIRALHKNEVIDRVFCTETRPYNQGARLTAFELVYEHIPATLVVDSAVSYLMKTKQIHAVVVGADRVCRNGDTANKIGTYQIAITAKHHGVPFFVAAPSKSVDITMNSGDEIHIEQRSETEITNNAQTKERVVVKGIDVWNPGFDVTPAELITGIITELGVVTEKDNNGKYDVKKFLEGLKK